MGSDADLVWTYRGLRVLYRPELDGRGSVLAPEVVEFIAARAERPAVHAFEWCSGPGFIGFALLAAGLCERLTLSDVNAEAIGCAERTVAANGLADRVSCHVGDNLSPLPADVPFDLVVANPPNFYRLNPAHPWFARYRDDLRPNDPKWRLHRGFYAGIRRHLLPGAVLHISEVDAHDATVHIPRGEPEPYDVRPRPAVADFETMIRAAGLEAVDTVPYFTGADGAELAMMTSRNPT